LASGAGAFLGVVVVSAAARAALRARRRWSRLGFALAQKRNNLILSEPHPLHRPSFLKGQIASVPGHKGATLKFKQKRLVPDIGRRKIMKDRPCPSDDYSDRAISATIFREILSLPEPGIEDYH
jgi:hypothetical protein